MQYCEFAPNQLLKGYVRSIWSLEVDEPAEFGRPLRITPDSVVETGLLESLATKVRLGLIGCGRFARSVLLPELKRVAGARLLAIAARSGINALPMGQKHRASYVTTDPDELLADPKIDAVIIATRHDLHASLVARAFDAGKAVLVEKPLAIEAEDAVLLERKARDSCLHLVVGHNRRYTPLVRRLLAECTPGPRFLLYTVAIRPLQQNHWTFDPVEGGGRLLAEADHFFDLLNLFADSTPQTVHTRALRASTPPSITAATSPFRSSTRTVPWER